MKIFIKGRRWNIKCLSDRAYVAKCGEKSSGTAILEDRQIYLKRSDLKKEIVMHEIIHGYCYELFLVDLGLNKTQAEEFFCELFSNHAQEILRDANKVFSYFSGR
jgi:hypothetical protein